ncbi:MAG TPA: hypothetical protein VLX60_06135 [Terriglobales bacterium]|nr:hypothetical protein [Terriglobales bacterium]
MSLGFQGVGRRQKAVIEAHGTSETDANSRDWTGARRNFDRSAKRYFFQGAVRR